MLEMPLAIGDVIVLHARQTLQNRKIYFTIYELLNRPGAGGEESREVFESAMKTVDATFQNLDSSEISLTDVSHYFDSDPTKLVQGLRSDGKMPSAYIADTTTANAQVQGCCLLPFLKTVQAVSKLTKTNTRYVSYLIHSYMRRLQTSGSTDAMAHTQCSSLH